MHLSVFSCEQSQPRAISSSQFMHFMGMKNVSWHSVQSNVQSGRLIWLMCSALLLLICFNFPIFFTMCSSHCSWIFFLELCNLQFLEREMTMNMTFQETQLIGCGWLTAMFWQNPNSNSNDTDKEQSWFNSHTTQGFATNHFLQQWCQTFKKVKWTWQVSMCSELCC